MASYSYFVWRSVAGKVLGVARTDGPVMQSLRSDGEWVDNPQLILSLREPDKYDRVSEADAREAAGPDALWAS